MAVITAKYTSSGRVAFGGISGTYAAVKAASGLSILGVYLANATDKSIIWSLDGGTTDFIEQPTGKEIFIPLGACGVHYNVAVSAKQGGDGAPTSGYVSAGLLGGS